MDAFAAQGSMVPASAVRRRLSPWLAAAASIAIVGGVAYGVAGRLKPDATGVRLKADATGVQLKPDATGVRLGELALADGLVLLAVVEIVLVVGQLTG